MMILQVDISYATVFIPIYGGITPYKAGKALEVFVTFLWSLVLCPISLKPFYFQSLHQLTLNFLPSNCRHFTISSSCLRAALESVSLTFLEVRLFIQWRRIFRPTVHHHNTWGLFPRMLLERIAEYFCICSHWLIHKFLYFFFVLDLQILYFFCASPI